MGKTEHSPEGDRLDGALRQLYSAPAPVSFQEGWKNAVRREEIVQMSKEYNKPKKWSRFFRVAAPVAAAVVLVTGSLWAGGQDLGVAPENAGAVVSASRARSGASKLSVSSDASNAVNMAASDMEMAAESAYDGAVDFMTATAGGTADAGAGVAPQPEEARKLVRTAELCLRTAAYDEDLQALRELLAALGGYVESVYESGDAQNGAPRSASLNLRVPSQQLDAFLSGAEGVGRVVSRSESTTDRTVQYADNEARLGTLRQKLTRLNELLAQAESVEDIIQIENAIADAQYQVDSYETTQRSIDRQVDMSQVSLNLWEDDPIQPTSDMDMGQRLAAALAASAEGLGRFFRNMLVFVVMALPVVVPLAVIGLAIWLVAKRRAKRREQREPDRVDEK